MRDADRVFVAEGDRALHDVAELAHVAGPLVSLEARERVVFDREELALRVAARGRDELAGERRDLAATRAERREGVADPLPPGEQGFAVSAPPLSGIAAVG